MKLHARGMSLVELLMTVAVGAIILGTVGLLYEQLGSMKLQTELLGEVEHVVHMVQDQLNNPILCGQALRDQAGNLIVWPDPSTPLNSAAAFNSIQVSPPTSATNYNSKTGSVTLVSYGQSLAAGNKKGAGADRLTLASMILRQPDLSLNETGTLRTTKVIPIVNAAGVMTYKTVDVVAAKIEFDFQANSNLFSGGGLLPPRLVDVTLELDQTTHQLAGCFSSGTPVSQNLKCAMNSTSCPLPSPGCKQIQYVYSFDQFGQPTCDCAIVCNTPPIGPPGPHKGGGGGGTKIAATTVFAPLHQRLKNVTGKRMKSNASPLFSEAGLLGDITNPAVRATKNSMFAIPDGGAPIANGAEN